MIPGCSRWALAGCSTRTAVAVSPNPHCGSGSIPGMCCIALDVTQCLWTQAVPEGTRPGQAQLRSQSPRRLHIIGYQFARPPHAGGPRLTGTPDDCIRGSGRCPLARRMLRSRRPREWLPGSCGTLRRLLWLKAGPRRSSRVSIGLSRVSDCALQTWRTVPVPREGDDA